VVRTSIQRPVVPLSLTFAAGLLPVRHRIREGILRFDRVESAVPFLGTRLPTVLFLHTWDVVDVRHPAAESRWRKAPGLYRALFDRVVGRMDRVYVLRPDMAEWLATRLPDGDRRLRTFTVPVDLDRFHPPSSSERAAERTRILESIGVLGPASLVVFAGRLEGQKNPLALPEVAGVLADAGVSAHILVAGTGSLEGAVADAAAGRAPGRVHLLGSIDQDRLAGLLGAADALLLPSAFEGLPNVVLESLASGTPVVATRSAGRTAEVLDGTGGGVIGDDDPRSLAAGIREVLSWPGDRAGVCRALAHGFAASSVNEPVYRELRALAGVRETG
jgi:glycosyltransferase involved in cell wall biosynthesis